MNNAIDATVDAIEDIHPDIRIVRLRVSGDTPVWEAGQYMELTFKGFAPRPYSIASAPHSNVLEFHIRGTGKGGASEHVVKHLKAGDILTLRGPFGRATHSSLNREPLLLIAGGMGISPLKAIVEDALHHAHPGPLRLYWGAQTAKDLYMADRFRALASSAFEFIPVTQDKTESRQGLVGEVMADEMGDLSGYQIYLSGPPAMIKALIPQLLAKGARHDHIHSDDSHAQGILPRRKSGGPS